MTITDYQLPYCTITGTFLTVDADSADEDSFPDVQPLNGTITLTPTTNAGRVDDAFAQILPVTVRVFGGQIVDDEDLPGVRILATDANIGVADWAWRASFKFDSLSLDPLTFKAPRDTTLNLTSGIVPIKSQPYQIIEGASIVDSESDVDLGLIRFKLSDGTYTRWVPGVGRKGEPGERGPKGDPGAAGEAATLSMGSVTVSSTPDAWLDGPPSDRALHLALPRGVKGDKGDKGDPGKDGEPGAEGPYGGTEVVDPQVAALISTPGTATSGEVQGMIAPTRAKVDAISTQGFPLREMTTVARGSSPIPCGSFDGYLWGTSAVVADAQLYRSSDGGQTWETFGAASVPVDGRGVAQGVQKILPTSDGEVLAVSFGNVVRSTGWASGSPTWTVVLTNPTASYIYPWGFDGDGTKFIVVHYSGSGTATPDRADSRYGWISVDGGNTWEVKWDTQERFGATVNGLTHIHGAAYDPWEDRFFINEGHDTATGVYVSNNDGGTWTRVPYGNTFTDSTPANAPTVVVATDKGMVFGSDDSHNGIYVLPRGTNTIEHVWAWGGVQNSQLLGYALQGFRDPATGIVYISYVSDEGDLPAPVGASDGLTANEVWREPGVFGMWRKLFIQGDHVLMWEQLGNLVARGKLGGSGARPAEDPGRVLGGMVRGGRKSVAVGSESHAVGDRSVAVGGGASTTTHNGTAVGADANAVGSGTSTGAGASSEPLGAAFGYQAKTTGGTSVGANAFTASVSSTAIGRGARAATDAGAANVNSTAIGRDAKANAASGNATAIGQGAVAGGAMSVTIGTSASSTLPFAVAIGHAATALGSSTVALGPTATSNHTGSVALGAGTSTTGNDQVQIGARHIEVKALAAEPVAPAAGDARLFTRPNGAGKTELCVRFNTGPVIVIATQP